MTINETTNFIDGTWIQSQGEMFESLDPISQSCVWRGGAATQVETDQALAAARKAFLTWSQMSFWQREKYALAYATALKSNAAELASLISKETGKPLWEARTEVSAMVAKVAISIESYNERCAPVHQDLKDKDLQINYKPHGVCVVFGPYNFPGHLPNGHIVPALLAGNTVVFKPSPETPAVGQMMAHLWQDVGLPNGVLNLVQGAVTTGQNLLKSPEVDGVFFTGGSRGGVAIQKLLAERPHVILALEMGGNNPLIVHKVKDLKAAALLTIQSAYITAGQRCSCARRLIVPEGQAGDDFLKTLIAGIQNIRVGAPDEDVFMGSLIHISAAQNILQAQTDLQNKGADILVEARLLKKGTALVSPGLIDVTAISERVDQEIFGPLLQVIRVKDFSAALFEANNTSYGLAAGLLSDERALYDEFYKKARAGIVNWNQPLTGASSQAPFGGVGQSGNHRPSAYFAADYCAYAVASLTREELSLPTTIPQGIKL